ncbi:transposase [Kocuria oceani]|uniref:Transposase n=1 Tax=Kocuria oceani TaxID=988827 RepID=A0ABV9TLK0_9MICC|nr:transposase [Kocuria oceani]
MVTVVGIDTHKNTHTLVAVDGLGRRRALEVDLLLAGHQVVRVLTRLMAGMRRGARQRGRSDPIDAEAVARVALREDELPTAVMAGPERDLKLLADHRRSMVARRSALQSKLRWFLHEIDPAIKVPSRALPRYCVLDSLQEQLAGRDGVVVEIAGDMIAEIISLTRRINELEARLGRLVRTEYPHLLAVDGLGVLGAATIVGETAGAARFHSKDAFARSNGTAPIPVWSGNNERFRLNRGGNRMINTALHMAAVTQQRLGSEGADYVAKQLARGKTRTEAMRLLRRRISDRAFAALRADERAMESPTDFRHRPDAEPVLEVAA